MTINTKVRNWAYVKSSKKNGETRCVPSFHTNLRGVDFQEVFKGLLHLDRLQVIAICCNRRGVWTAHLTRHIFSCFKAHILMSHWHCLKFGVCRALHFITSSCAHDVVVWILSCSEQSNDEVVHGREAWSERCRQAACPSIDIGTHGPERVEVALRLPNPKRSARDRHS